MSPDDGLSSEVLTGKSIGEAYLLQDLIGGPPS